MTSIQSSVPLANKIVVITGAGSGVGRGLAEGFCRDGATVVGFGRTAADLEAAARQIGNGRMHCVAGDLARPADIERLFAEVNARFGRIDILINNAALYPKVPFLAASPEEWAQVLQVNVIAMAHCCRIALPGMLERGFGRVLNVGSFAHRGPIPSSSAYSASKAAVSVLTKCIALEVDRVRYPDVLVNEFLPGVTRTRMSDQGADPAEVYPHAKHVATLPANGPHGVIFDRSELVLENPPRRGVRGMAGALARRLGLSR